MYLTLILYPMHFVEHCKRQFRSCQWVETELRNYEFCLSHCFNGTEIYNVTVTRVVVCAKAVGHTCHVLKVMEMNVFFFNRLYFDFLLLIIYIFYCSSQYQS
jgi:hypothetical protein